MFHTANQQAGAPVYRLRYVGREAMTRASNGMAFATAPLAGVPARGMRILIVPGADEAPMTAALGDSVTLGWIGEAAATATRVCSVCSGAFILAELGLLAGRRVATHWRGAQLLAQTTAAPTVDADALFVEDRGVWTSAGVTAGIDMALAIVERDLGRPLALAVAREMVLFLIRPGGQAQFSAPLDLQARSAATDLRALPGWLEVRLGDKVGVEAMAHAMGMSQRTFHRRCLTVFGETPLALLQRLRLERARALLEDGGVPLKAVAVQAGFGDVATLRRVFRQAYGVAPLAYRSAFAGTAGQTKGKTAHTLGLAIARTSRPPVAAPLKALRST